MLELYHVMNTVIYFLSHRVFHIENELKVDETGIELNRTELKPYRIEPSGVSINGVPNQKIWDLTQL